MLALNKCFQSSITEQKDKQWVTWKPSQIKGKRHRALTPRAKGIHTKEVLNAKIDTIAEARGELIQLQKKLAEKQLQQSEEEHQIKMELLQ